MRSTYDGIILGTGHNALILQTYLSRCGLRTLSLDRAAHPGGGLCTMQNPRLPGFVHHPHSFFHRAITAMPWFRDLQLQERGVEYLEPELNVALILHDGRSLQWWTDLDRTVDSVAQFSKNDAAAVRRWAEEFVPIVDNVIVPEAQSPPLPPERRRELLNRSELGRRFLEVSALSPLGFVRRELESDAVRAGLLFYNGLREIDPRLPGFGHAIPALLASRHKAQMSVGGSGRLAEALITDVRAHGGEVRTGVEISAILVKQGRAVGVRLADGDRITAQGFVASGLNPQQTFLDLLDPVDLPAELRDRAAKFKYNLLAPLFALNVALSEPPRYRAATRQPELDRAFMVILGLERLAQFDQIVDDHERGELPPMVTWGACPTLFDPSQAPPGCHVAFQWQKVPYALRGDARNWEKLQQEHGRAVLEQWNSFAPNLASSVLDWFTRSPLETEQSLPNMHHGDLLVGSFADGQIGYNRPFAGAGQYRTPIGQLYLCGGSTHPGGNVTGLCGYNAARVIATEMGLKIWWSPPDLEATWVDRL